MLASSIREDDQISLVSSTGTPESAHRAGHRIISPTVFSGCLPSFGGHHENIARSRRSRTKSPSKDASFWCRGRDFHVTDSPHCSSKSDEMSPGRVCRTSTLSTSITEPQLSDFGSKVPMDFSRSATGKIISDPNEVVAMLKEEQWRAKDQVRFHSPDNRIPHLSSYLVQPWFHGQMSREEAVSMLCASGIKEGTFLVRLSRSLPGCFVLSLVHNGAVLHYPVTQVKDSPGDRLLSLDSGRTKFMDLLQLVEFYQVNSGNPLPTTLRHYVTRSVDVPNYGNPCTPRSSF